MVYLRDTRPDLTDSQLFHLTALPLISAAFLRVVYAFMVPIYGGRRWTLFSTAILLIPLLWMIRVLAADQTPFWVLTVIALLSGLGGAVFASCQANVSLFFPRQQQGVALGINAAIGNSGVGLIQLVIPFMVAFDLTGLIDLEGALLPSGTRVWLTNVPLLLAALIALVCVGIAFCMNDLSSMRFPLRDQVKVLKNRHVWIMSVLYTFAFGSFIGFAAGFPLMLTSHLHDDDHCPVALPPLYPWSWHRRFLLGFLASYVLLFAGTGLGIGSVTEMVLDIFAVHYKRHHQRTSGETNCYAATGVMRPPALVSPLR